MPLPGALHGFQWWRQIVEVVLSCLPMSCCAVGPQDEDVVPSMPYYHQYLWYNLVMMATWGVKDIKLAMIDAVRTQSKVTTMAGRGMHAQDAMPWRAPKEHQV